MPKRRTDRVLEGLDAAIHESFGALANEIRPHMERAFRARAKEQAAALGMRVDPERLDQLASGYSELRAKELEKQLRDNTPHLLEPIIETALAEHWDDARLESEIADSRAFGLSRAITIDRTETTISRQAASEAVGQAAEADEKSWTINFDDACELCQENAAASWIEASGDFPNEMHTGCRCDVIYRMSADEDERKGEEETGEGDEAEA